MKSFLPTLLFIASSQLAFCQKFYFKEAIDFDQLSKRCQLLVPFPAPEWNIPILSVDDQSSSIKQGDHIYTLEGAENDDFLKGKQVNISPEIHVQYFKGIEQNPDRLVYYNKEGFLTAVVTLALTPPAQQGAAANP